MGVVGRSFFFVFKLLRKGVFIFLQKLVTAKKDTSNRDIRRAATNAALCLVPMDHAPRFIARSQSGHLIKLFAPWQPHLVSRFNGCTGDVL